MEVHHIYRTYDILGFIGQWQKIHEYALLQKQRHKYECTMMLLCMLIQGKDVRWKCYCVKQKCGDEILTLEIPN